MTATRPISVGVVGAGAIATRVHIPVLRASPAAQIAWIADSDTSRARAVAQANRLQAIEIGPDLAALPPCDAIVLAIPNDPRRPYFELAAKNGTAVLAEKPLAANGAEHERLMSAFEPWRLGVGFQRRHYATSRFIRESIRRSLFGELREVRVREGARTTRFGDWGSYQDTGTAKGGGVTKNLGCHTLDLAFWVTEPTDFRVLERRVEWDGDTDRSGTALVRLLGIGGRAGHDCDLHWTVSWLERQPNTWEFRFERATLRCPVGSGERVDLLDANGGLIAAVDPKATGGAISDYQAFFLEWDDFLAAVRTRSESSIAARTCLKGARLMDELLLR